MNNLSEQRYRAALDGLAGFVHGRNGQLVRIAHLGLAAGRDPAVMRDEIIDAGGEPRLTEAEVTRAVNTALRSHSAAPAPLRARHGKKTLHAASKRPLGAKERSFVQEMIAAGAGATSASLMASSPLPVDGDAPTAAFLWQLFRPDELIFTGTPQTPRSRENLRTAGEIVAALGRGEMAVPSHFTPNPFTGQSAKNAEGKESYCLISTVAHRRHAVVEFDGLALKEQAAFWAGVIRERVLAVRSLVFSGNKSIHALVELKDDGSEATWKAQWETLERALCSDTDAAYHADRACKDPTRMSRFPGGVNAKTGKRQRLIWLG